MSAATSPASSSSAAVEEALRQLRAIAMDADGIASSPPLPTASLSHQQPQRQPHQLKSTATSSATATADATGIEFDRHKALASLDNLGDITYAASGEAGGATGKVVSFQAKPAGAARAPPASLSDGSHAIPTSPRGNNAVPRPSFPASTTPNGPAIPRIAIPNPAPAPPLHPSPVLFVPDSPLLPVKEGPVADLGSSAKRIEKHLSFPENRQCADCDAPDPKWVGMSNKFVAIICIRCSGVHRALGTHISRVRSLELDLWDDHQIAQLEACSNKITNQIYEGNIPPDMHKPTASSSTEDARAWIIAKYKDEKFKVAFTELPKPSIQSTVPESPNMGHTPPILIERQAPKSCVFKPGDECRVFNRRDAQWRDAIIDGITDDGNYLVVFNVGEEAQIVAPNQVTALLRTVSPRRRTPFASPSSYSTKPALPPKPERYQTPPASPMVGTEGNFVGGDAGVAASTTESYQSTGTGDLALSISGTTMSSVVIEKPVASPEGGSFNVTGTNAKGGIVIPISIGSGDISLNISVTRQQQEQTKVSVNASPAAAVEKPSVPTLSLATSEPSDFKILSPRTHSDVLDTPPRPSPRRPARPAPSLMRTRTATDADIAAANLQHNNHTVGGLNLGLVASAPEISHGEISSGDAKPPLPPKPGQKAEGDQPISPRGTRPQSARVAPVGVPPLAFRQGYNATPRPSSSYGGETTTNGSMPAAPISPRSQSLYGAAPIRAKPLPPMPAGAAAPAGSSQVRRRPSQPSAGQHLIAQQQSTGSYSGLSSSSEDDSSSMSSGEVVPLVFHTPEEELDYLQKRMAELKEQMDDRGTLSEGDQPAIPSPPNSARPHHRRSHSFGKSTGSGIQHLSRAGRKTFSVMDFKKYFSAKNEEVAVKKKETKEEKQKAKQLKKEAKKKSRQDKVMKKRQQKMEKKKKNKDKERKEKLSEGEKEKPAGSKIFGRRRNETESETGNPEKEEEREDERETTMSLSNTSTSAISTLVIEMEPLPVGDVEQDVGEAGIVEETSQKESEDDGHHVPQTTLNV